MCVSKASKYVVLRQFFGYDFGKFIFSIKSLAVPDTSVGSETVYFCFVSGGVGVVQYKESLQRGRFRIFRESRSTSRSI